MNRHQYSCDQHQHQTQSHHYHHRRHQNQNHQHYHYFILHSPSILHPVPSHCNNHRLLLIKLFLLIILFHNIKSSLLDNGSHINNNNNNDSDNNIFLEDNTDQNTGPIIANDIDEYDEFNSISDDDYYINTDSILLPDSGNLFTESTSIWNELDSEQHLHQHGSHYSNENHQNPPQSSTTKPATNGNL